MSGERSHFFDLDPQSLGDLFAAWGWPRFRAAQVMEWVYRRGVADPTAMTNLSKRDRDVLAERMVFLSGAVVAHQVATDGVQKLLVDWGSAALPAASSPRLGEGGEATSEPGEVTFGFLGRATFQTAKSEHLENPNVPSPRPSPKGRGSASPLLVLTPSDTSSQSQTECVLIPTEDRKTACISSQVGCPVGCKFCASGIGGLDGNLTAGRIVEQVWRLGALPGVGRVTNVVFMGMGEPLANFDSVTRAIGTLMADWGLGISGRKITISTVGVPAPIRRLADLELPVTLALSLHAPNDELRRTLIPWAEYVTIDQLVEACRYYFDKTGREITLEYILLRGVNDRPEHARELAHVARRLRANVNLIRYNEVKGLPFGRPATEDVREFQDVLRNAGVNTHIRASRGRDIAAACGQLRHEKASA